MEDMIVFATLSDNGASRNETPCRRLFGLPPSRGTRGEMPALTTAMLDVTQARRRQELLKEMARRHGRWFDTEMDKLDR